MQSQTFKTKSQNDSIALWVRWHSIPLAIQLTYRYIKVYQQIKQSKVQGLKSKVFAFPTLDIGLWTLDFTKKGDLAENESFYY